MYQSLKDYVATCAFGLESVLADELSELGCTNIEPLNRSVAFTATLQQFYTACLSLRTAIRVLRPIREGKIRNEKELYREAGRIPWTEIFDLKKTFAISAAVSGKVMNHSQYASLVVKDAIADQFRNKYDERPNVHPKQPDIAIHVHIHEHVVRFSLDAVGQPLFKRGYGIVGYDASLNECLAAGIIQMMNWRGDTPFIDLMCGSGTSLIEAQMIAERRAPNLHRDEFCFKNWQNFDADMFNDVVSDLQQQIEPSETDVIGFDNAPRAISIAKRRINLAQYDDEIEVARLAIQKQMEWEEPATIFINPPYGERLQPDDINQLYSDIGAALKHKFMGSIAWLLSSNKEAIKHIGLRPSKKVKLLNGKLECVLLRYDLYKGSKKQSKQTSSEAKLDD